MLKFWFPKVFFGIDPPAGGGGSGDGGAPPAPPAPPVSGGASYPGHTPPPAAGTPPTPPAVPEFATLIPAEYKDKPWVKDTKDLPTLFKRVDDLQSELGKRPSAIPQENAKPEEWTAFNKAFGVPEKPEDYKFSQVPDGLESSPEFQKGVQDVLHKAGISARQFKLIEPAWNSLMLEMAKNTQAGAQALDKDFDKLANTTFGERKDAALSRSKAMIDKFIPPGMKPHLAKLSNENLIIMAGVLDGIISKYVSEDDIPKGGGGGAGPAGEEARREEARKLMQSDAYKNGFHPEHAATVQKVAELYRTR